MRKITLLLLFLLATAATGYSQCFQPDQYPNDTVISNNMGFSQQISTCNYTLEYAHISNISIGSDYVFTCTSESAVEKYITVTDTDNNVIAMGDSPLTVNAITADEINVHYTNDAACAGINQCHITTLQIILTCPVPLNAAVSNITTTSADFMWEAGGVETAWEVLVLPAGSDVPGSSDSGTAVTTTSYTATSLTPSEAYDFYVRANCGSEFSPWTLALNFNMACNPISSFNENFDAGDTGGLLTCWNAVLRGEGLSQYAYVRTVDYGNVHSEPNSVELYNSDSSGDYDVILVSPNLSNLGAGTHRMKFYARGFSNLQVGTIDGFSDTAVFTSLEDVSITEDGTQYTVDFTSYSGTDTYIGIRLNATNSYSSAFVDDILWELSPSCPDVTEIAMTAVGTNTASVSWVAGGTETAWEVAVGEASVTDPATLTALTANATDKDVTGLTDNTDYKVWVRSVCAGNDYGAWIGPITFTTACLPVTNFYEDFDSVDTPELPGCWTEILRGPTVSDYASINTIDFNSVHSDPNSVEMYNSSSNTSGDDDVILVSPNLSNVGAGTHRLKFYAKNNGSLQIGTMDMNTIDGVFSILEEVTTSSQATQYTIDFSSYSGTDTYVAIRMNNSDTYTTVLLDDILWEVNPTCPDVTEVSVPAVTTDGATVTWIAGGTETSWNIAVGPATTTDPSTLTPITSNAETAELTDLTENTAYKVWVRSACAGNQNGAWIGPVPFRTACLPTANFNENFDTTAVEELPGCWTAILRGPSISEYANVGVVNWEEVYSTPNSIQLYNSDSETAGADDVMLVSPNLSTLSLGTYRLKFYAKYAGSLQIGTLDSNTNSATFSMIEEITTNEEVTEYKIDFSSYTGPDTYVAIRLNNSNMYSSVYLDNIIWEIAPTCPDVTDVVIDGTTTTTADISWVANGPETQWQTVYTLATEDDPTTGTPVSSSNQYATISGLTPATIYNVWVRSVCAGNDNGAWIGPVEFRTLCVPTGLPFNEDFESATPPGLPTCGSVVNLGDGNEWIVTEDTFGANNAGFTSKTLTYNYNFANAANTWFFTGGVTLQAGIDYNISYRYGDNADDQYSEDLQVMAGTSPSAEDMSVEIANYTGINSGTAMDELITFNVPADGVYYFGFNAYSTANQYFIYVDDITVDIALSTPGLEDDKFSYYPNPVKDVLTLTNTKNIASVAVYNMLGQQLIVKNDNSTTSKVDMSALPNGNYVVKVTADGMTKTVKVLKK